MSEHAVYEHIQYESMYLSLVLRQYMRGENVLLIQIGKQNVKFLEKISRN